MIKVLQMSVFVAVVASVAWADPSKPRVMVILDTSRSMKELPKYINPGDIDVQVPIAVVQDGGLQGDFEPGPVSDGGVSDNDCANKFCAAKKVINRVIPPYTTEARIGLTTYFQYVLTAVRNSTLQTSCRYDVFSAPGVVQSFMTTIDYMSNGGISCTETDANLSLCPANTRKHVFPRLIQNACDNPTGWVAPVGDEGGSCTPGAPNCYEVFKTNGGMATTTTCTVGTFPVVSPQTYTHPSSHCLGTGTKIFRLPTVPVVSLVGGTGATGIRNYVSTSTSTCAGSPQPPSTSPTGPSVSITSSPISMIPSASDAVASGYYLSSGTLSCSSGTPCNLFLASATPTTVPAQRHWYGFHNNSFTPSATFTPMVPVRLGGPYAFSTKTAASPSAYNATVLSGTLTMNKYNGSGVEQFCDAASRRTMGTLSSNFGITNPKTTLDATAGVFPPIASKDETPDLVGSGYGCSSQWPCDGTLGTPSTTPGSYPATGTTVYSTIPALTNGPDGVVNQTRTMMSQDTFSLRLTNGSTTCPVPGAINGAAAAPANTEWTSTQGGCTGAGYGQCTFTAGASPQPDVTAPGGTCPSPVAKSDGTPPANCSWNSKAYVAGATTTASVTLEMPHGSTCSSGGTIAAQGSYSAGCGSYPCNLTNAPTLQTVGSPDPSVWVTTGDTAPSGYSGAPAVVQNNGGQTQGTQSASSTGSCLGANNAVVSATGALCNGTSTCKARVVGYQVVGTGCGPENGPCYACVYQPLRYRWTRNNVRCNYQAQNVSWTVDRTAKQCQYRRNRWELKTKSPDILNCPYTVGARRYDFANATSQKYCSYFAVKTEMQTETRTFTYKFRTKGTELIGRGTKTASGSNACAGGYGAGVLPGAPTTATALTAACPESISNCAGVNAFSTNFGTIPAGASCRLSNGGDPNNTSSVGQDNARWSNYKNGSRALSTLTACEAATTSWTWPSVSSAPAPWCSDLGTPSVTSKYLVSDWYDPTQTNSATAFNVVFPPSDYTVTSNNTTTKAQGFGGILQPATMGTGALPSASLFVPIPSDASYDPIAQKAAIKAAVRPCIMPGVVGPDVNGRLAGGACASDMENPSAPGTTATCQMGGCVGALSKCCSNNLGKSCSENRQCWPWQDFTPLYGSLKSTYAYLLDRWTNDDNDKQCRDYFIVLATDGKESTPLDAGVLGGNPASDVEGLVGSFRNLATGVRTRPDVKTFVVAFGENIGNLNNVASAGGTNQAFAAGSLSELETALQAVFTSITQGTFSRSRPALGTDGKSLYAAQFVRPSTGPDWSGKLTAWRVDTNGNLSLGWEHGAKLNNASHPARNIRVGLKKKSDSSRVVGNFDNTNGELVDQLNDRNDFPATKTSSNVISFVRSNTEQYWGDTLQRSSKLGPVVASAPVVVSKSPYDVGWGGSTSATRTQYSNFITNTASRGTRVYFQGNDGMLHSVIEGVTDTTCTTLGDNSPACTNGREDWSFIPGPLELGYRPSHGRPSLVESLFRLPQGAWADLLLDNTLAVADVCGSGSNNYAENCSSSDWKTIAIGTQRGGGRSAYAVNLTDNGAPNTTDFLWEFNDGALGFTYSVPVVGRAEKGSHDLFVSVMGGGLDDPNTGDQEGRSVFVLEALNGDQIEEFRRFDRGSNEYDFPGDILGRPALFRRPTTPYMTSVFVPASASLYAMRFATPSGAQHNNKNKWKPDELFDPTSTRNTSNANDPSTITKVRKVVVTVPATPTTVAEYGLTDVQDLPLTPAQAPSIYNRPKVATVFVPGGTEPDLFVGTGDVVDPANPSPEFQNGNYFYAVHDFNQQLHSAVNDGKALWVVQFPGKEQVVSEPAIIRGCVIVATYTPPAVSAACSVEGDTTLYGFNPVTGALTNCLVSDPITVAGVTNPGVPTPVVKLSGVGIPSDLVTVNETLFLQTSVGGLQRAPVSPARLGGGVRSYRRLK